MKWKDNVRSKAIRFIAFVSCVLCVGLMTNYIFKLVAMADENSFGAIWGDDSSLLDDQADNTYEEISWFAKLYLDNLDENGEWKNSSSLSEAVKNELLATLEEERFIKQGRPAYANDKFDFFISNGKQSYSNVDVGTDPEGYFSDTERYPIMWSGNGDDLHITSEKQAGENTEFLSSNNYIVSLPGGLLYYQRFYHDEGEKMSGFFGGKDNSYYFCEKEDGSKIVLDEAGKEQYLEELFGQYLKNGNILPAKEDGKYYIDKSLIESGDSYSEYTIDELIEREQENAAPKEETIPAQIEDGEQEQEEAVKQTFSKEILKQYIAGILVGMDKLQMFYKNGEYLMDEEMWDIGSYIGSFGTIYDGDDITVYLAPKKSYLEAMQDHFAALHVIGEDYLYTISRLAIVLLLLMVYLVYATGYNRAAKKYVIAAVDKIHMEFTIITFCILVFIEVIAFEQSVSLYRGLDSASFKLALIWYSVSVALVFAGALAAFLSMVRRVRTGYKKSLIRGICHWLKEGIRNCKREIKEFYLLHVNTMIKRQVILLTLQGGITLLAGFFGAAFTCQENGFGVLLVCGLWLLLFVWWFRRMVEHMKEIAGLGEQIDALYEGNYEPVDIQEDSIVADKADKLNHLSEGMKTAVERQVAAEKMKVELITNVSHDLKTPLTSIISYVDLLAKEELQPEAADYVRVLEDKAARLSHIVSDVFDLAKASSGTEIAMERLDGTMLLKQVLADMEDQIRESGRTIKESIKIESYEIMGDGQKLYRVFQNLLDNALKYSMEGTRIFVALEEEMSRMTVEVKNIASYEMDFTAEEILERFSRGDKARTTEGNGLGLSIAQSFTYVCGGSFDVQIDGDMFKVRVSFPAAPIVE